MAHDTKPIVAIVGRPNVGKSTLFNRLAGRSDAIVSEVPGTTRDRVTTEAVWGELPFILVDTGGLDLFPETEIGRKVHDQIGVALDEADLIIIVVDSNTGVTAADRDVADSLRRTEKPLLLAANKADNESRAFQAAEFYELGLGDPMPISAYHNLGVDDLMAKVVDLFPAEDPSAAPEPDLSVAIVGRTNVGKSMLLNAVCGEERAIVTDVPGTTRDALDTLVTYDDRSIRLVDTAGIRRRGRIEPGIERYSALRAIRAIDRADVAVLVMDVTGLATSQDTHIASYVLKAYRGIVLAINKWDLAGDLGLTKDRAATVVRERFRFATYAPICFVSALRASGIGHLMDTAHSVHGQWSKEVPRYDLRRTVLNAVAAHPPATAGRRALKIYGVSQDQTRPPSFTFHVNRSDMVHFSYRRYLENRMRDAYGFEGTPVKMRFKGRGERVSTT